MKYATLLIFILISTSIFSQQKIDSLYFSNNNQIVEKANAEMYEIHIYSDTISGNGIVKRYKIDNHLISETEYININSKYSNHKKLTKNGYNKVYFDNGNIKYEGYYKLNKLDSISKSYYESGLLKNISNYLNDELSGSRKTFFESGNLKVDGNYKAGKLHGDLKTYFENGILKRNDVYNEGDLVSGHFYDEEGKEIEYVNYIIKPEYEGGYTAISQLLSKNLKYPKLMIQMGLEGKVFISFEVKKNGKIEEVKVLQSPSEDFTKEALRVFYLLKEWKPGKIDGEFEDFKFTLPINFSLN